MGTLPTDDVLDAILATQLTVAWAGEGRCAPKRLGWWDTDLIDEAGGGDLLARLLPQTHAWAGLQAVLEAARRVDAKARARMVAPDGVRSLFFLGFELDERLADRLASLKRGQRAPHEALTFGVDLRADFSTEKLVVALRREKPRVEPAPGGLELKGAPPEGADEVVRNLAAALVRLQKEYPLPFYRLAR